MHTRILCLEHSHGIMVSIYVLS